MTLTISGLSKRYPNGVQALNEVSLNCETGIYGLLGQNGAGKSTLMRTLATLQEADEGSASLDDLDLLRETAEARKDIGYLPQEMGVYPNVTALECLEYFAGLKGLSHLDLMAELEKVNLANEAHQRLDTFSGGMRRRFGIAVAFLGKPKLVIVDEPTAGLDPFERRRFQHILAEASRDCILILSSHIVEDIADLAGSMAILHKGKVLAEGNPDELIATLDGQVFTIAVSFEDYPEAQKNHRILSSRPGRDSHLIRVHHESAPGSDFTPVAPTLEDYYAHRVTTLNS